MAHNYLLFTKGNYHSFVLPESITGHWNLPTVDENGNPLPPYTVESAIAAANLGTAPPVPVKFNSGGKLEDTDDANASHYLCPLNNIPVEIDDIFRSLVEGEGVAYKDAKLTAKQAYELRN